MAVVVFMLILYLMMPRMIYYYTTHHGTVPMVLLYIYYELDNHAVGSPAASGPAAEISLAASRTVTFQHARA
jgi:hypothetical protein